MTIPFKVKLLTNTAKAPERANEGDLWDLFADDFCAHNLRLDLYYLDCDDINHYKYDSQNKCELYPKGRILVKTGIALELPVKLNYGWEFFSNDPYLGQGSHSIIGYAVADLRPRSGLAIKNGLTVLNTPGTIDNSYRKEIGVILYNAGHGPYTISKGDKICQMLIRPLYPSKMEIVKDIKDTGRGAYGSTGK